MNDKSLADVADNIVNHLSNGLEKLTNGAESLSNNAIKFAPQVWKVLVKQQEMLGIQQFVFGACWFIAGLIALYLVVKLVKTKTFDDWNEFIFGADHPIYFFMAVGSIAAIVVPCICGVDEMSDGFIKCMNPQYYAAQNLIDMVKSKAVENK